MRSCPFNFAVSISSAFLFSAKTPVPCPSFLTLVRSAAARREGSDVGGASSISSGSDDDGGGGGWPSAEAFCRFEAFTDSCCNNGYGESMEEETGVTLSTYWRTGLGEACNSRPVAREAPRRGIKIGPGHWFTEEIACSQLTLLRMCNLLTRAWTYICSSLDRPRLCVLGCGRLEEAAKQADNLGVRGTSRVRIEEQTLLGSASNGERSSTSG